MSSIPYNYGKYLNDKISLRDQGHVDSDKQISSPASAGSRGLAKTTQFTNNPTQMKMGNSPIAESIVEIRNILNRIDGVNVPVQEDDNSDYIKQAYMLAVKHHTDGSGDGNINEDIGDLIEDYNEKATKKISPEQIMRISKNYNAGGDYVEVLSAEGIDGKLWLEVAKKKYSQLESAVQEKRDNSDIDIRKLLVDISSMKDRIAELAIDDDAKTSAFTALAQVEDDIAQEIQGKFPEAVKEDLDYRSEDILNKAGFDPADIDTYMKVFNDHGDTSDIDQMNMKEKVGLADVMSMVLASHGIQNESYEPFPEEDEMTFEDDDAFYEAFGELGFPEDENELFDAEYRGRKVPLNKPMRGDVKKFKVYVKDPKSGNVKKVNFGHGGSSARKAGQKTMKIRKSNPKARKSFRARHNCANPGPKTKARYWSCRKW